MQRLLNHLASLKASATRCGGKDAQAGAFLLPRLLSSFAASLTPQPSLSSRQAPPAPLA